MTTEEPGSEFVKRVREEWDSLAPAVQASSEGRAAGLELLLTNAVSIARTLRDELGEVDPSAEKPLLIALCTSAYQLTISPEPSSDICQVLAAAAIRIMDMEDMAAVTQAKLEILRSDGE